MAIMPMYFISFRPKPVPIHWFFCTGPKPIQSTSLFGELKCVEIPMSDFKKLTRIPIIVYYGDNIAN